MTFRTGLARTIHEGFALIGAKRSRSLKSGRARRASDPRGTSLAEDLGAGGKARPRGATSSGLARGPTQPPDRETRQTRSPRELSGLTLAGFAALAAVAFSGAARGGDDPDPARVLRDGAEMRDANDVSKEIDAALAAAWKTEGLVPTPRCGDDDYVRRVYLDLVGTIPSAAQVEAFLDDPRPDKRELLVTALLKTPGYSRHFADLWSEVLVGAGGTEKDKDFAPGIFRPWIEKELAARRPYPQLIASILTADGNPYSNPPVNFFGRRAFTATDLAGGVSKAFLGVQIQCAQCHDHPYEDIRQKDFQGMAAFFARMTLRPADIPYDLFGDRAVKRLEEREEKMVQDAIKNGMTEAEARADVRRKRPKTVEVGELKGGARLPKRLVENEKRLEKIPAEVASSSPKFLHSVVYDDAAGGSRRAALASWIANPANPYTARALANRYWGWLMGRGIVNPVDDFSSVNIASVPAALEILTKDTAESGFDFDRLVRVITQTKAYQLSSASAKRDARARDFFSVGPLKQFSPQQTFDSMQVALGIVDDPTLMTDVDGGAPSAIEMEGGRYGQMGMGDEETKDRTKLMMTGAARSFFQTFDDDEGGGSTAFEGTVPQGLFLMNSQAVNGMLTNPAISVIPEILKAHDTDRARIRHLFVRTLARTPTEKEMSRFSQFVKTAGPTGAAPTGGKKGARAAPRGRPEDAQASPYADLLWALVSSSEFGTNH